MIISFILLFNDILNIEFDYYFFHLLKHFHLLILSYTIGRKSTINVNCYKGNPLLRNRAHKVTQCDFTPYLKGNVFI